MAGGSTSSASRDDAEEDGIVVDKGKEDVRKMALEFTISLNEAKQAMVRASRWVDGGDRRSARKGWESSLMATSKCSWRLMCVRGLIYSLVID